MESKFRNNGDPPQASDPAMDAEPPEATITELLSRFSEKDPAIDEELLRRVYKELRVLAYHYMRLERPGHILQPTALINEAYLRLEKQRDTVWQNKKHFYAIAALLMRRILVDVARHEKSSGKSVMLTDILAVAPRVFSGVLDVHKALERLAALEPRHAHALELKYFGGLSNADIASCMGIREVTVEKYLRLGRAFLATELDEWK